MRGADVCLHQPHDFFRTTDNIRLQCIRLQCIRLQWEVLQREILRLRPEIIEGL